MMIENHYNEQNCVQNCVEKSINCLHVDDQLIFERINDFHKMSKNNSYMIVRFVEHSIVELIKR
jgi:hypothetical protein